MITIAERGREAKFVVGDCSEFLMRSFLTGKGIKGAHLHEVVGYWEGKTEHAVALYIGGISQGMMEEIAEALCVYFAQASVYVLWDGTALVVERVK